MLLQKLEQTLHKGCGSRSSKPSSAHTRSSRQPTGCGSEARVLCAPMRCVLCGGPLRPPTALDAAATHLPGGLPSYRWLGAWHALWTDAGRRVRGQTSAFYAHKDCVRCVASLDQRLSGLQYDSLWPHVGEHLTTADPAPDTLPEHSYGGVDKLLAPLASSTVLSGKVTASSVWMLHSPLACTANAGRILRIWAPRLTGDSTRVDRRQEWAAALGQRLKTQGQPQHADRPASGIAVAAPPDVLSVLLAHAAFHDSTILAKLHLTSKTVSARVAAAMSGRLRLRFSTCSTEDAFSFALWLTRHAGLVSSLDVALDIKCCDSDAAAADAAILEVARLLASAPARAALPLTVFGSLSHSSLVLTSACNSSGCLRHLAHLTLPDIHTTKQLACLPRGLLALRLLHCTMDAAMLTHLTRQCPQLSQLLLSYSMWSADSAAVLAASCGGWAAVPLTALQFDGACIPSAVSARRLLQPCMPAKVLLELPRLAQLTKLVFNGCCVAAPLPEVVAAVGSIKGLRQLRTATQGGLLTLAPNSQQQPAFVDSSIALQRAVSDLLSQGASQ